MKKLSAAQEKALSHIRQQVREARESTDLQDFYNRYQAKYYTAPTLEKLGENNPELYELVKEVYYRRLKGIALVQAGGPTVKKLEALGYIRIIEDTTGTGSYRSDLVQLL